MPRVKLIVAYDGTNYHGFQRQVTNQVLDERATKKSRLDSKKPAKRGNFTVQECLEQAMLSYCQFEREDCDQENFSAKDLKLTFSSRTDKGVHAKGQTVAVTLPQSENDIRRSLNSRLPSDISIESIEPCLDAFEPRFDVKYKIYSYTLRFGQGGPPTLRSAFDSPVLWLCPWELDALKLEKAAKCLEGTHDFTPFVHKSDRESRSHHMTVDAVTVQFSKETYGTTAHLTFQAKGFRRSMVRNMVGYSVDVARGLVVENKWPDGEAIINSAPASGLCLEGVYY